MGKSELGGGAEYGGKVPGGRRRRSGEIPALIPRPIVRKPGPGRPVGPELRNPLGGGEDAEVTTPSGAPHAENYGEDEASGSHGGDARDSGEPAGSLTLDQLAAGLEAEGERAGYDGRRETPESFTEVPFREVIDGLGKVTTALKEVLSFWDQGVAELTDARAAGHARGITEQNLRRVIGMRPAVEQALTQTVSMQDSVARGSEPAPGETAELAVQLTAVSETAVLVRQELPSSRWWRRITDGLKTAMKGVMQTFVALTKVEITGVSVTFGAGLPFNLARAQVHIEMRPRLPGKPGDASGGAAPAP